jgi:DNA-binding SARP family transcriptional activator/tetratricopeptide (TPR) repeat protein
VGATIRVQVLGRFAVSVDGRAVPEAAWRRRQAAALVKLLALAPRATLHREQVIDALWPDVALADAAPRLHKAAHFARKAIGDGAIAVRDEVVSLGGEGEVEVDLEAFLAAAATALEVGSPAAAADALERCRGVLLPGDLYEPWTEAARQRVDATRLRLLRQAGRWEELVALDPADESAHVELMRALASHGDRRAALRQFERLDRALRRELGVGPGAEAVALRDELLAAGPEPPAVPPSVPPAAVPGLEVAEAELAAAAGGRGRAVLVAGPPGAGKSALLSAVAARASAAGWRVGRGGGGDVEGGWPYAPVLGAIADLCRRHPALLDGLDDALRAELERLLAAGELRWRGDAAHRRLFVAAAELVRLAAAGAGAALLVDDLDEADLASARLLAHLVRTSSTSRVLVVATFASCPPGELADLRAGLLERDLGSEVVLAAGPSGDREPRAVAALDAAQRAALQPVAVAGEVFDTDGFVAVSGLGEQAAFEVLDAAHAAGALEATASGYRFRNGRIRAALAGDLPPHRLRALHREVADRLVTVDAPPARIAHHLLEAGDRAAAVPYVLRAVRTQAAVGAYRDALRLMDQVRAAADGAAAAELAALRADVLAASGDIRALQAYREAIELADAAARRPLVAGMARTAVMAGDLDTARAVLEGVELDGGPDDVGILLARANLAYLSGDPAGAAAAAEEARGRLVDGDASWQLLDLVAIQGLLAHQRGEWFERLRLELGRTQGEPALARAVFDGHLCVAEYLLYGPTPYDEVIDLAVALGRTAARSGAARAEAFAAALAGEAALLAGTLDVAAEHLQHAVDLHREIGAPAGEAHSLQRLAEVRLAEGDRPAAEALLQRALRLARWSTLAMHLLQRIYGTMIAAAPDPEAARAVVDRAATETGGEDVCQFCQVMLAVPAAIACARVGDLDAARSHLAAAERSASMWDGTAWQAAVTEAAAEVALAEGRPAEAAAAFGSAAGAFEAAGHPLDAARTREALASVS